MHDPAAGMGRDLPFTKFIYSESTKKEYALPDVLPANFFSEAFPLRCLRFPDHSTSDGAV